MKKFAIATLGIASLGFLLPTIEAVAEEPTRLGYSSASISRGGVDLANLYQQIAPVKVCHGYILTTGICKFYNPIPSSNEDDSGNFSTDNGPVYCMSPTISVAEKLHPDSQTDIIICQDGLSNDEPVTFPDTCEGRAIGSPCERWNYVVSESSCDTTHFCQESDYED